MLCLSMRQPWSGLVVSGLKTIEVRTWAPPRRFIGERVAIHAGKRWDDNAPTNLWLDAFGVVTGARRRRRILDERTAGVIGVATLCDIIKFTAETFEARYFEHLNPPEWYEDGFFGLEFADAQRFAEIIPCRGRLGFFEVGEDVEARVQEAIR